MGVTLKLSGLKKSHAFPVSRSRKVGDGRGNLGDVAAGGGFWRYHLSQFSLSLGISWVNESGCGWLWMVVDGDTNFENLCN